MSKASDALEIQKWICRAVEIYLDKRLSANNGKYTYNLDGLIMSKSGDRCNVKINGQIYENMPCQSGLTINIDDRVDIMVRNGNSSQMKIVDILHW